MSPPRFFHWSDAVKEALREIVRKAVQAAGSGKHWQEPNYTGALVGRMTERRQGAGWAIDVRATGFGSSGPRSPESLFGADFGIHVRLRKGKRSVDKGILVQGKIGRVDSLSAQERERLLGQVERMRRYHASPQVLEIPEQPGEMPTVVSGNDLLARKPNPRRMRLDAYVVGRLIVCWDGTVGLDPASLEPLPPSDNQRMLGIGMPTLHVAIAEGADLPALPDRPHGATGSHENSPL